MSSPELLCAVEAVRRAAAVCESVGAALVTATAVEKGDRSPVTVADFASQAVVCAHLAESFPGDVVVGEEGSADLLGAERAELRRLVVEHASRGLGREAAEADVLAWIDRGGGAPAGRFWTLDPIDGTAGFLRGRQYAIALALVEAGRVVLGVLGCPRFEGGILLAAERGRGTAARPLGGGDAAVAVRVAEDARRFVESVDAGHTDQGRSGRIAARLGITEPPVRLDSQVKYAAVARGDAGIYLRLPTRADYRERIWDHAAGAIVVEEAGGTVTDTRGEPLDFTRGKRLERNEGVVATNGSLHAAVLAALR